LREYIHEVDHKLHNSYSGLVYALANSATPTTMEGGRQIRQII